MKIEFYNKDGDVIHVVDMDVIPRRNESITFAPSDDRPDYKVASVEYNIENNTCTSVCIWLI